MVLHPLFGHREARLRLATAFRNGRLPQVMMVTGPAGIGKQRLALWLAQLLLCEAPADEPCDRCRQCRLVQNLSHPDLHWFVPIPRPKSGEPDRQVEEAQELLVEAIADRRETPFYQASDGMAFHPLASIRLLLRRAILTPVQGGRKIFVLGEADRLVPQESSPEAANALLKFLEEPAADTWVVLTAIEAERVLPTIRSRVVPVRLSQLPDSAVRAFLETVLHPKAAAIDLLIRQAGGAIGKLAGTETSGGGGGGGEGGGRGGEGVAAVTQARAFLAAIEGGPGAPYEVALRQQPWAARGGFTNLLDALAGELAAQARAAAQRPGGGSADRTAALVSGLRKVAQAREEAQGNVNPQLLLADLAAGLAEVL